MSRTQSQGIEYFPFAVDFFADNKVKNSKSPIRGRRNYDIYVHIVLYISRGLLYKGKRRFYICYI